MTTWRYLEDNAADAAEGLATDEALMLTYGRTEQAAHEATLRLYTYRPHCALVGRYQSLEDEIDIDFCQDHDVQIGRRPTGGGAIIMGEGQLGVAITARARPDEAPRQALKRYAHGVIAGLGELGIEAQFRSKNDLEVDDKKIAGLGLYLDSAGAILFHASVLVDLDVALMLRVLRIPGAKISDKAIARVGSRVTTVSKEIGADRSAAQTRAAFRAAFARTFSVDLEPGKLASREAELQSELVVERYANEEWILQRSPRRDARGSALLKTPFGLLRIYVGVHGRTLKSVLVTGDFNLMPQGVARLESALKWCQADPIRIAAITDSTIAPEDLGVPTERVSEAIWRAASVGLELQDESVHPFREGSCYFPEAEAAIENTTENG
jgi:lipoate-protein ligase A